MAGKYEATARGILDGVGGEDNVAQMNHCATRLRLRIKDMDQIDKAKVEATKGVITTVEAGGQFQVVIGNDVPLVFQEIVAITKLGGDAGTSEKATGNLFNRFVAVISAIFMPILWPLAGAGLLKALLALAVNFHWISADTTGYVVLSAAADAIFYFLPIILAMTAAKRFGTNQITSMALAGALVYPSIVALASSETPLDFFGIPLSMVSYTSSVIPIVLAVWLQSYVEKWLTKVLPGMIRNFSVPLLVFLVMVPLTLLTIGPVTTMIAKGVAGGIGMVWGFAPWLAGGLLGGFWQALVMFGLHTVFFPLIINDFSTQGFTLFTGPLLASNLAQAGAAVAVALRARDLQRKELAATSAVSGFVAGITEPIVYGVNLPLKRPFIFALVGGGIGGAIAAAGGSGQDAFALPGLIALPTYMNVGSFPMQLIGSGVAVAIAFVLTFLVGFKEPAAAAAARTDADTSDRPGLESGTANLEVVAPMVGTVVPLSQVNDPVFSSGAMGKGYGIRPADGRVLAPFDGTVMVAMDTGHAVGLKSTDGVELLIHIGIDTVNLGGKHFTLHCKRGDVIHKGDPLVTADLAAITAAGYDPTTIVVCTNSGQFTDITTIATDEVDPATPVLAFTA